jgi:signal transduction histidine kinase
VLVDVGDDGPGVQPEISERVFDSFVTTKDVGQGTGLGLATARRIVVDRHDGTLTFDSRPGETVFHVRLPVNASSSGVSP